MEFFKKICLIVLLSWVINITLEHIYILLLLYFMHWKIWLDLCLILARVLEAIVVYKSSYDVCVHVLNCEIRFRILTANLKMILSSTCISMISTYSSIHIYRWHILLSSLLFDSYLNFSSSYSTCLIILCLMNCSS